MGSAVLFILVYAHVLLFVFILVYAYVLLFVFMLVYAHVLLFVLMLAYAHVLMLVLMFELVPGSSVKIRLNNYAAETKLEW
jgi:hypothetical protein